MANMFRTPDASRFVDGFVSGDTIDVVNWPSPPSSTAFSTIPADTVLVMPFMVGYILRYNALNFISTGNANITWGLYSYSPSDRFGDLLNSTGEVTISGTSITQVVSFNTISTLYPGRTYAIAVNSSASWTMLVLAGNGAGCSRILGGEYSGGNYQNYTHLRDFLTYNAQLPASLSDLSIVKSNAIWPPNPLFRVD